METNYAEHLASMTVTEFRQFKRALSILHRSGLDNREAIHILIDARIKRELRHRQDKAMIAREMSHYRAV
jgi:hypothetical protein